MVRLLRATVRVRF